MHTNVAINSDKNRVNDTCFTYLQVRAAVITARAGLESSTRLVANTDVSPLPSPSPPVATYVTTSRSESGIGTRSRRCRGPAPHR
jgi:hypothetical protein